MSAPRSLWPVVVLVGLALAAVVAVLVLVPDGDTRAAAVIPVLMLAVTQLYQQVRIEKRTEEIRTDVGTVRADMATVKEQTDGRMSELIAKIPGVARRRESDPARPPPL